LEGIDFFLRSGIEKKSKVGYERNDERNIDPFSGTHTFTSITKK
jgi:hypothetical protein